MTTVTIPKKSTSRDLIAIPKKEYEEFLAIRKFIKEAPASKEEKRLIKKGEREIQQGKYREWRVIKNELARNSN